MAHCGARFQKRLFHFILSAKLTHVPHEIEKKHQILQPLLDAWLFFFQLVVLNLNAKKLGLFYLISQLKFDGGCRLWAGTKAKCFKPVAKHFPWVLHKSGRLECALRNEATSEMPQKSASNIEEKTYRLLVIRLRKNALSSKTEGSTAKTARQCYHQESPIKGMSLGQK